MRPGFRSGARAEASANTTGIGRFELRSLLGWMAVVLGAVAAVVLTHVRNHWRWTVLALPLLLPPAIGTSRIHVAAHYPTDVLAGLVLGGLWVFTCAHLLLPPSGRQVRGDTRSSEAAAAPRPR